MYVTPNQGIKPLTYEVNKENHVCIGGCDVVKLAEKYGTPLYIYCEKTIREMCKAYKKAFAAYPKVNMLFAGKSFMTKAICCIVEDEGFGLDLVSGGEIYTARNAGFDMSKTVFNGNNKFVDELTMAIKSGVGRFSVDNFLELSMLNELAKSNGVVVDILLRITPGIECHTHEYIKTGHSNSKFGFDMPQIDDAIDLILDEYKNLNLRGLHAHIGSQIFDTEVYYDEVGILLKEVARIKEKYGFELKEINLGGGLGVTYTNDDSPASVYSVAQAILSSLEKHTTEYGLEQPTIYIEPGRSLVATAGVSVYTTGSSKFIEGGTHYIAVDGGMADNVRPITYGAEYTAEIANKPDFVFEKVDTYTIAGRFCESGDILIKETLLPQIEEGDVLCVYSTGAYGYSMASNYNRVLKPAVVLVAEGVYDVIVAREDYEHLTCLDRIPERLKNK